MFIVMISRWMDVIESLQLQKRERKKKLAERIWNCLLVFHKLKRNIYTMLLHWKGEKKEWRIIRRLRIHVHISHQNAINIFMKHYNIIFDNKQQPNMLQQFTYSLVSLENCWRSRKIFFTFFLKHLFIENWTMKFFCYSWTLKDEKTKKYKLYSQVCMEWKLRQGS